MPAFRYIVFSSKPNPADTAALGRLPISVGDLCPRSWGAVLKLSGFQAFGSLVAGGVIVYGGSNGVTKSLVLIENDRLILDCTPGQEADPFKVVSVGQSYPSDYECLAYYKNGRLMPRHPDFAAAINHSLYGEAAFIGGDQRCKVITEVPDGQGGTMPLQGYQQGAAQVLDRLFFFADAPKDHSATAEVRIHSASMSAGFPFIGTMTHNFGHAGSADYHAGNRCLLLCNGEKTTDTAVNRIDILSDFDSYGPGALLDWFDPVSTPRVTIDLVAPTKQLLGNGAAGGPVACWAAGRDDEIWLWQGVHLAQPLLYRLRLGKGLEDLSGSSTNWTRWGTFNPLAGPDEFNGTAEVLYGPIQLPYYVDYVQGLNDHHGELILPYTRRHSGPQIEAMSFRVNSHGQAKTVRSWRHEAPDPGLIGWESEGSIILNGRYLLLTGRNYDNANAPNYGIRWAIFSLDGFMDGDGILDANGEAQVAFPIYCNTAPVHITTQAGVTNKTRLGFTATGTPGAHFTWEAKIG